MKSVFYSLFLIYLSACNLNQNLTIRGVDLHTHEENHSSYVDLETIISMGNLKLPNSVTAIKNTEQEKLGEVTIQHLEDGTSRIAISVNFDEAIKSENSLGKTLPNGREIPTSLENESALTGIQIFENSRLYIGGSLKENLYAGISLNIPALDHIFASLSNPLNLLMNFPFSNEVFGIAGIYSSSQNGQNGLAIFAKKSQSIHLEPPSLDPLPTEIKKLDQITLLRLNYLFSKHATLRIK